jgi:hypothetical protein
VVLGDAFAVLRSNLSVVQRRCGCSMVSREQAGVHRNSPLWLHQRNTRIWRLRRRGRQRLLGHRRRWRMVQRRQRWKWLRRWGSQVHGEHRHPLGWRCWRWVQRRRWNGHGQRLGTVRWWLRRLLQYRNQPGQHRWGQHRYRGRDHQLGRLSHPVSQARHPGALLAAHLAVVVALLRGTNALHAPLVVTAQV